jgi:hypothetical protein
VRAGAARRFIDAPIFELSSRTAAREDARRTRSLALPSRSISSVTVSKRWPPRSAGTKKCSAASNAALASTSSSASDLAPGNPQPGLGLAG